MHLFRKSAAKLVVATFLSLVSGTSSLADGPQGGQDPPGPPRPGAESGLGAAEWDPIVQAVVLITQVALL